MTNRPLRNVLLPLINTLAKKITPVQYSRQSFNGHYYIPGPRGTINCLLLPVAADCSATTSKLIPVSVIWHGHTDTEVGDTVTSRLTFSCRYPQDFKFCMTFVTNAQNMTVGRINGDEVVIACEHVDHDGTLKTPPPGYSKLVESLKVENGVELRFVFTGVE